MLQIILAWLNYMIVQRMLVIARRSLIDQHVLARRDFVARRNFIARRDFVARRRDHLDDVYCNVNSISKLDQHETNLFEEFFWLLFFVLFFLSISVCSIMLQSLAKDLLFFRFEDFALFFSRILISSIIKKWFLLFFTVTSEKWLYKRFEWLR
jgi:hypothetical protein